jgi:hypothetical protein
MGTMGDVEIVKSDPHSWSIKPLPSTISGADKGLKLDTSATGEGLFFGTIGNQVRIKRLTQSGIGGEWSLGSFNADLRKLGGIRNGKAWMEDRWEYWTEAGASGLPTHMSRKVCEKCVWDLYPALADQSPYTRGSGQNFAPSPESAKLPSFLLTQNSVKTEIWEAVPLAKSGYWPATTALSGAHWHISKSPIISVVGVFEEEPTYWQAKGWWQGVVSITAPSDPAKPPAPKGKSYNNVTLVDVLDLWSCEMIKDYYTPGGEMSLITSNSSDNVNIAWDSRWACETTSSPIADPPRPDSEPETVALLAFPEVTEKIQPISFRAFTGKSATEVQSLRKKIVDLKAKKTLLENQLRTVRLRPNFFGSVKRPGMKSAQDLRKEIQSQISEVKKEIMASARKLNKIQSEVQEKSDQRLVFNFMNSASRVLQSGPSNVYTDQHKAPGNLTITVELVDQTGKKSRARATSQFIEPIWDTLVLYRRWNQGWDARASQIAQGKVDEGSGRSLVVNASDEVQDGFMKGTADLMSDWLIANGNFYKDLVNRVTTQQQTGGFRVSRDAVVTFTRIDPMTGARLIEAGIWYDYADPRSPMSPFKTINDKGKTHLDVSDGTWSSKTWGGDFRAANDRMESQYQASSGKTLNVNGKEYQINVVGYQNFSSPIILDLTRSGQPDLLAGPDSWKKGRETPVQPSATRRFNLDGTGAKYWEWVGPTAGILVWGRPVVESPDRLFGTKTWGREWADGYAPLRALDKNEDGVLTGEELKDIFVWIDSNSDAVCEASEIVSLKDLGIIEINASPSSDEDGNTWSTEGFKTDSGQTGMSWDWWSLESPPSENISPDTALFKWNPLDEDSGIPGGVLSFNKTAPNALQMISLMPLQEEENQEEIGIIGIPFDVEVNDNRMRWETITENGSVATSAILEGATLIGVTVIYQWGVEVDRYEWVANQFSGFPLKDLLEQ